jgi:hypothetical protein
MDDRIATEEPKLPASELEDYFASISDSFESTRAAEHRRDLIDVFLGIPVLIATFSVLPVIPMALQGVVQSWYASWHPVVAGWALPTRSVFFWWFACVALCVPLAGLAFKVDAARSKQASKDRLGQAAMRFALCYAVVQDLDRFAKNGIQKHAERAQNYWAQLQRMIQELLNVLGGGGGRSALNPEYFLFAAVYSGGTAGPPVRGSSTGPEPFIISSLLPEIYYIQRAFPWFRLEPITAKILNALSSLPWKVTTRLRDGKDLPSVASALLYFSSFLYTLIPEVSGTGRHTDSELSAVGEGSLVCFADALERLSVYKSEPRAPEGKERVGSKLAVVVAWLGGLFVHETPVVKFIAWWALGQAMVIAGLAVSRHYIADLKLDSTLVSLIIGTPLVVSAAALAGAFRKK